MDIHRPELKQRRRRRFLIRTAAAAIVLIGLVVLFFSIDPALPEVPRAQAWLATVERGELVREVRGPGSLVPRVIRWIPAASGGRVERIVARPGAVVEPDTVLVELSNPELAQQLDEAEWAAEAARADRDSLAAELQRAVLEAQGQLAGLQSDAASARLQADAEKILSDKGIVSTIQYRQTELRAAQLETRAGFEQQRIEQLRASHQAQLAAEAARVERAQRLVERRRRQIEDLIIRAGMDGVLQEIAVEPGQQVELGANVARVARPDQLIAELRIAETQAREIALGQPVRVDLRSAVVVGRVMRLDPAVQNGTVQVDVEFDGPLPDGARPDLSVDGTIELETLRDVLHVARPVVGQPEGRASLYRLVDEDRAERTVVEFGRASVGRIEVRAGLVEGDRVIVSDMSRWAEHERIRLD